MNYFYKNVIVKKKYKRSHCAHPYSSISANEEDSSVPSKSTHSRPFKIVPHAWSVYQAAISVLIESTSPSFPHLNFSLNPCIFSTLVLLNAHTPSTLSRSDNWFRNKSLCIFLLLYVGIRALSFNVRNNGAFLLSGAFVSVIYDWIIFHVFIFQLRIFIYRFVNSKLLNKNMD